MNAMFENTDQMFQDLMKAAQEIIKNGDVNDWINTYLADHEDEAKALIEKAKAYSGVKRRRAELESKIADYAEAIKIAETDIKHFQDGINSLKGSILTRQKNIHNLKTKLENAKSELKVC